MKLLLCGERIYKSLLRTSKEIHFICVAQPSHKNEKCYMFRFIPSLSKETTIAEKFLHDVLGNPCLFSVILKSHSVKK